MKNKDVSSVAAQSEAWIWLRGPITLTPDQWLVLDRAQATTYAPLADAPGRASVFDLANIRTPKDAVRFAEQHGLLWHGPDADDLRELFKDWWEEANDLRKTLEFCLALQTAQAENGSTRALRSWLGRAQSGQDADVLAEATARLTERINHKLAGCVLRLAVTGQVNDAGRSFSLGPAIASPLHRAYFHLAQLLVNNAQFATCAAPLCGRYFEQADPRQQYCSPACANRARQRRWAERARSAHTDHSHGANG